MPKPTECTAKTGGGSGKKPKSHVRSFYGNMEWFSVSEQPDGFDELPKAFKDAEQLWRAGRERNLGKVIKLLTPYVRAVFLPYSIDGWEGLFADPNGGGMPEYEAKSVHVVGIDFSSTPIPVCKAEAHFDVLVTDEFQMADLEEWQADNASFTDAISFGWNIPRTKKTEEMDFTAGDHQGAECMAVEQE